MARQTLDVVKRAVLGRKVRKLRREGILPANLYGKNIESVALELPLKSFEKVFAKAGETGLVDLKFDSEIRPVLVHNVQRDPLSDYPIHVDFHQVSLKEKTRATVPIELVGESPAVHDKLGILIQTLSEVEVEALPQDFPESFQVDISNLAQVGEVVTVGDIKFDKEKIEIKITPEEVVAKIDALAKEEEVAPPPVAEGEEGAPTETPTEGEEDKEGGEEKPVEEEKKEE